MSVRKDNIILIGMPASGKSTVGVLLAKRLGFSFLDTDLLIQIQEGKLLKEIIAEKGRDGFLDVEDRVNAEIGLHGDLHRTVISPGGSVIFGKNAMDHLKSIGTVVYLKISFDELTKRLVDLKDRGVVLTEGMTLRDLYEERVPYYEKYADMTLDETGKDYGGVVDELRRIFETAF